MGPDAGGVEIEFGEIWLSQRRRQPLPDPGLAPAVIATPDTVPVAEPPRQITPWNPRPGDKQHSVHKLPVIGDSTTRSAAARQKLLDQIPLFIRQFMSATHYGSSLSLNLSRSFWKTNAISSKRDVHTTWCFVTADFSG
jgi:hypothetical protein